MKKLLGALLLGVSSPLWAQAEKPKWDVNTGGGAQLKDVKIDFAWSGNFALTLTRIPHMGKLSDTVYFSHGDSGHGVTTTHLLGKILGEAVHGQMSRFDVWSSLQAYPFPGGRMFRVPFTALGAWYYGLRDRLGV